MRKIPLEEFQADCLAILDTVQRTKAPVVITKQGRPMARLVPILVPVQEAHLEESLGRLEGIVKIVGDIESPIWPESGKSSPHLS